MNAIPTAITKRLEPGFASLLTLQKVRVPLLQKQRLLAKTLFLGPT